MESEDINSTQDGTEGGEGSTYLDLIVEGLIAAGDPEESYTNWKVIGHGGTADVYKANRTDDETATVAIKKFRQQSSLEDIGNELRTLQRISTHNHINTYIEGFVWENNIYIVLEYCTGSCTDILQLFKEPLKEVEIAAICRHCVEALSYVHGTCKIVHRDIKAGNLLVSTDGKIMLADFGISKMFDEIEKTNTFIGSPYWMAPEVILAMETGTYSYPVDIWALGITLIELAETKPPHFDLHGMSACYRIASGEPPKLKEATWSKEFHSFLNCCLQSKPEDRWTASQLSKHGFVDSVGPEKARDTIKDLLVRSNAAVKAVDISALTDTGLIVNIPPKLEEESPENESTIQTDGADNPSAGIDFTDESKSHTQSEDDSMEISLTKNTTRDIYDAQHDPEDDCEEEEIPVGFDVLQKVKDSEPTNSEPMTKKPVAEENSIVHSKNTSNDAFKPKLSPQAVKRVSKRNLQGSQAKYSGRSPTSASALRTRSLRKTEGVTLKLPSQLELERNRAMRNGGMLMKAQMREITKLRGKHTEELQQLRERQKQEQAAVFKTQEHEVNSIKKSHTGAMKDFTKETEQENSKLTKQHTIAKKKIDEALRSAWNQHRKLLQAELKQTLSDLKKEHKLLKMSKQEIADVLDSAKNQRNKEIEDIEKQLFRLESTLLDTKQKTEVNRHQLARLNLEYELRRKHLEEFVQLQAGHKTGPLCDLQRQHIIKVHQKQLDHQQERQALIMGHYRHNFQTELVGLEKQHTVEAKQLKTTLKKLPVVDEQVVRLFNRRASQKAGHSSAAEIDTSVSLKPEKVKTLPKESLRGLKSAKEEHTKILTVRLSQKQMQMMEQRRKEIEGEAQQLGSLLANERKALENAQREELHKFDKKIDKTRKSAAQYVEMERKNFEATRKEKMKKPLKRAGSLIESYSSVMRSTVSDLVQFYSTQNRKKLRPLILSTYSYDLYGQLPLDSETKPASENIANATVES